MLVLSRRPQQSLLIGHDVIITVLEVNGDTVRIGISAPAEVQIHREEVYRDLQASNREAAAKPGAAADLSRRVRTQRKGGAAGSTSAGSAAADAAPSGATPSESAPSTDTAGTAETAPTIKPVPGPPPSARPTA